MKQKINPTKLGGGDRNVTCSIILINYNTFEFIKNAINSVFEKTKDITYEVIVVDNASLDGHQVKAYFKDKIIYIENKENVGFGRANNVAIKITKGRNIFFLNPDTLLKNNAVKILSDYLDNSIDVAVCGGNLYNKNDNPTHSYMKYLPSIQWEIDALCGFLISKIIYGKNTQFNHSSKPQKVGYITGADMMVRKTVLDEVGVFDEDFFMYFEETELTYRIKKKGYKVMSIPMAQIIHFESKSFSCNEEKMKNILASRKIYYKKTHIFLSILFLNTIYLLTCCLRMTIFSLVRNKEKVKYYKLIIKYFL